MTANPHVVLLNKAYPPWVGGIERHVQDIAETLVQRGWRITALVCNDRMRNGRENINGVEIIRVSQISRFFSQPVVWGYYNCLKKLQPSLVHVHVPYPLGWLAIRHIPKEIPLICTWHSDIVRQRMFMPFLSHFQNRFLQRCNRIAVTSQPLLDHSPALQNHRDRCEIIPLSINPNELPAGPDSQATCHQYQQKYGDKIVLFVGRLVEYKGLSYLIDAMKNIDATLLIAGDGPLRNKLQDQADSQGLASKIVFLGHVSDGDKYALYRTAAVTVLPSISRNEAFGYVLLEAMEQNCPVITTDLPTGMQIVNQHEETGLVVPSKSAPALEHALRRIVDDIPFRNKLAKGAKERVQKYFNFHATMDQLERIYWDSLRSNGSKISVPVS